MNKILSIFSALLLTTQITIAQCNGYTQLCDKKFNEVTTVMTHNAFNNTADGFLLGNQTNTITQQLEDGVRGLMLDVYNENGVISQYHGVVALGIEPLSEDLGEIKAFLDANPNEIISIIFQTSVTSLDIENELTNAGLFSYLHHHTLGTEWSTLQEMIDADERLVIFSESDNGDVSQTWYHYAWAHVFDTDYSYSFPTDFHCGVNRGDISNDLYLVNHWITTAVGTGDIRQANIVNPNPFLLNRLQDCQNETGRIPNFIGVDFYEIGGAFEAVEMLNSMTTSNEDIATDQITTRVFPNPINASLNISIFNVTSAQFQLFDMWGRVLVDMEIEEGTKTILSDELANGVYIYILKTENGEVFDEGRVELYH